MRDYINRDDSWIDFNERVLYQATRKSIPIRERLKFIGICTSNLDEFIMVRFAAHMGYGKYDTLRDKIIKFKRQQENVYSNTMKVLKDKEKIKIVKYKNLKEDDKIKADKIFKNRIVGKIMPISTPHGTNLPRIRSKELCALIGYRLDDSNYISTINLSGIDRVFKLSDNKYIMVEDLLFNNLIELYGEVDVYYKGLIKLNRSASMELNPSENKPIVDKMKKILDERERSIPVLMDVSSTIPKDIRKKLSESLNVHKEHMYVTSYPVDLSFLISKPFKGSNKSEYPEVKTNVVDIKKRKFFSRLDKNDIVLHHPYDSFKTVEMFLEAAATDDNVKAISQTLYRVSSTDSSIINSLCKASANGKFVTVMVEVKARFDESQNMNVIEKLKQAGCDIVYGIDTLKTHAKFSVVTREDKGKLKQYAHIGTGNYNDKTSTIYTDISLFTSDKTICSDLTKLFNVMLGQDKTVGNIEEILFAPHNLRQSLYKLIDNEINNAKNKKPAFIRLKLNSISDQGIIKKLYEASNNGVKVDIICRGVCSIKPINKNITIKSIVGRYLEHSRIYIFANANEGKVKMFISSSDLLNRNLDKRIEVMIPVKQRKCLAIISNIFNLSWKDQYNSFGLKKKKMVLPKEKGFDVHKELSKNK